MRIRTAFGPAIGPGGRHYSWRAWVHQGDVNAIGYGRTEAEAIGRLVLKRETSLDVHCIAPPGKARVECSACGHVADHYDALHNGSIHLGCHRGPGVYIYVNEEAAS
jgi:hypothetical protein